MNGNVTIDLNTLKAEYENLKTQRNALAAEAGEPIVSEDYKSGPNKELIDRRFNQVNRELVEEIAVLDKALESLENAIYNYEAAEKKKSETLSSL